MNPARENLSRDGESPLAPLAVAPLAVAPLAVAPLAVAPLAVAPLAVAPLAVAPLAVAPLAVAPLLLRTMTSKKRKPKPASAQEMRERVEYAIEATSRLFRRSDVVTAVMEKFGVSHDVAIDVALAAEDALVAKWGEGETDKFRAKIADVFEKIIRNPDATERNKQAAAQSLARLIGANRPKIVKVETATDEAMDALIREQLSQMESEKRNE